VATSIAYFAPFPCGRMDVHGRGGRFGLPTIFGPNTPAMKAPARRLRRQTLDRDCGSAYHSSTRVKRWPIPLTVGVSSGEPTAQTTGHFLFSSRCQLLGDDESARDGRFKPLTEGADPAERHVRPAELHRELNVLCRDQLVSPSGVLLTIFNIWAVAEDVPRILSW